MGTNERIYQLLRTAYESAQKAGEVAHAQGMWDTSEILSPVVGELERLSTDMCRQGFVRLAIEEGKQACATG